MTLACFGIYHWHVSNKLRHAETELRQLRSETGRITVEDETKVHVVAIDTSQRNTWRWRMFIPKGHRYSWNVASKNIPNGHPPDRAARTGVSNLPYWERDNEVLVNAQLHQDADGQWRLGVTSKIGDSKNQMSGVTIDVPPEDLEWVGKLPWQQVDIMGKKTMEIVDPAKPIILLSKRPMKKLENGDTDFHEEPCPGLMIWLAPR